MPIEEEAKGTPKKPTAAELQTQLAAAKASMKAAAAREDIMAVAMALKAIKAAESQLADIADEAEKGQREALIPVLKEALGKLTVDSKTLTIVGTLRRDDNGRFSDVSVAIGKASEAVLIEAVSKAFPTAKVSGVRSIKAVEFTITGGKAEVSYSGSKAHNGGGGQAGKGWVKDGKVEKLSAVFEAHATANDRANLKAASEAEKSPGSAEYAVKVKVAKAAGYVLNE